MSNSVQLWNGGSQLDRRTQKHIDKRQQEWALAVVDTNFQQSLVSQRIEGGAVISGNLNHWIAMLSESVADLQYTNPEAAARCGFVLDQLAVNGSQVIGTFMKGA